MISHNTPPLTNDTVMAMIALDRDECITSGLKQGNTDPEIISASNPFLTAFLDETSSSYAITHLYVGSSRQYPHGRVDITREYSGFITPKIIPPNRDSLLGNNKDFEYQDDYSKVLIVLGHMLKIQALLKTSEYAHIKSVIYYFIDDKAAKLGAIMNALSLRPDLITKTVSKVILVQHEHDKRKEPLIRYILDFNNTKDVDYPLVINQLKKEFKENLKNPVFIKKQNDLIAKGYRCPNESLDLSLSIVSSSETLKNREEKQNNSIESFDNNNVLNNNEQDKIIENIDSHNALNNIERDKIIENCQKHFSRPGFFKNLRKSNFLTLHNAGKISDLNSIKKYAKENPKSRTALMVLNNYISSLPEGTYRAFLEKYKSDYNFGFFKSSNLLNKLLEKEIVDMDGIRQYAENHKNSRTARLLKPRPMNCSV